MDEKRDWGGREDNGDMGGSREKSKDEQSRRLQTGVGVSHTGRVPAGPVSLKRFGPKRLLGPGSGTANGKRRPCGYTVPLAVSLENWSCYSRRTVVPQPALFVHVAPVPAFYPHWHPQVSMPVLKSTLL